MKLIKEIVKDYNTACDNHEQYQKMQKFFKGEAQPMAIVDFMHFDYLPKPIVKFIAFKTKYMNKFFSWWMNFHRLSFLTLLMIIAIIYIVSEIV